MELRTDKPLLSRDLDDLDQPTFRVCTDALHAGLFVFLDVVAVELVAMAMAFADSACAIDRMSVRTVANVAFVTTEAHGAAHIGDVLLLLHDVDDIV